MSRRRANERSPGDLKEEYIGLVEDCPTYPQSLAVRGALTRRMRTRAIQLGDSKAPERVYSYGDEAGYDDFYIRTTAGNDGHYYPYRPLHTASCDYQPPADYNDF